MRANLIILTLLLPCLVGCQNIESPTKAVANPDKKNIANYSVSWAFGIIKFKIPNVYSNKLWCDGADNEKAATIVSNLYEFKTGNDSSRIEVAFPLKQLQSCFELQSSNDPNWATLEDELRMSSPGVDTIERRIIELGEVKCYGLIFAKGFYIQGCKGESIFNIMAFNVSNKRVKDDILNSIELL